MNARALVLYVCESMVPTCASGYGSTGWWYRPDYIINQLNINSAISSPGHAKSLPINFTTLQEPYIVKGYAYSGKYFLNCICPYTCGGL
jgi:uncharacterized protein YraI